MRTRRLICVTVVLVLLRSPAFCATAVELFQRSRESERHVSYRGMKTATLCSPKGQTTAVLKVLHMKPDRTRTEYFAPPALAGVIVVQEGPDIWRFCPDQCAWKQMRPCCKEQCFSTLSHDALENYELRLVGPERLAGRPVYEIYAQPKSPNEAARRLWIDSDHYLVLGTQVESTSGQVLNKSRFTKIEFNPRDISSAAFHVTGRIMGPTATADQASFRAIKPSYVPSGYKHIGTSSIRFGRVVSIHLQFSNGVNTISVFQRKKGSELPCGETDNKLLNVYTCTRGDMQFTLIGSLPRRELRKMAESIR